MNSRSKGKRGELDFAHYLADRGMPARRGQQFRGGEGSPDVVCEALPQVHFEVKFTERTDMYAWIEQALADGGEGKYHVVAHRKTRGEWLAILPMEELLTLLENGSVLSG